MTGRGPVSGGGGARWHRGREGVAIQVALGKVIRAMGVKEFAARIDMAAPNVQRAINPRHNPTLETLNRLLDPFKLRLVLAPAERPKQRRVA